MSPFFGIAFVDGEIFVRLTNTTTSSSPSNEAEHQCVRLKSVGGANVSALTEASKLCGARGEWKRRIAEELSAVFFVGGWDTWPKSEGETIEVKCQVSKGCASHNLSCQLAMENCRITKETLTSERFQVGSLSASEQGPSSTSEQNLRALPSRTSEQN